MAAVDVGLIEDIAARGLISQMTSEEALLDHLKTGSRTLYCGFDPTADSLHIGSLVPLLTLKRFQQAGHRPLALVGGATGLIGDPSGKSQERNLNTSDVVATWSQKLKVQLSRYIDFEAADNPAAVVNNLDWTQSLSILDFLRDVGKHFSVNNMIQKESVKQRLDREGEGISYTEFTYMILQSFDFAELYKSQSCTLQIGGSDQWGNITGGVDLARRLHGGQAYGLTLPLVTKSDGTKFGKTEAGTIWLDSSKTSPYAFYQFWLRTSDADVYKFLKYFTFLSVTEIDEIEAVDASSGARPMAQGILAEEVTKTVHGEAGLQAAMRITQSLFSGELEALSETDFEQLSLDGLPSTKLAKEDFDKPFTALLSDCGMASAGREVKDALARNAVIVNGDVKGSEDNMKVAESFVAAKGKFGRFFLVKLGKKKHHLFELGR